MASMATIASMAPVLLLLLVACARRETRPSATPAPSAGAEQAAPVAVSRLRPRILATWPHDRTSFTQGLLCHRGALYESTGLYGRSTLRRLALETGEAVLRRDLAPTQFGEGLALGNVGALGNLGHLENVELVQLTWREGVALRYDPETLAPRGEFRYSGEGWGLVFDGQRYVRSDGTAVLRFHDAGSFAETGRLEVTLDGRGVDRLNELEWSEGSLYANRWGTDEILRIDPASGKVTAVIDASGLLSDAERRAAEVLNGIAYDPERRVFYLTGKLWPRLFEVVFEAMP
jgi:glutamine cyclotransferase